jgi:hypothetical protein
MMTEEMTEIAVDEGRFYGLAKFPHNRRSPSVSNDETLVHVGVYDGVLCELH